MLAATRTIDEAFEIFNRTDFLPPEQKDYAGLDLPLPIGHGQTISQPTTVRRMLEWLDIQPDDKILDIGSGSGWTTALMSHITGPFGIVYAVERIKELLVFGSRNCQNLGITNIHFLRADHDYGLPRIAPYNRILVSAEVSEIPVELINQLEPFGKMVIPVSGNVLEITRISETEYETVIHPHYAFVPLV